MMAVADRENDQYDERRKNSRRAFRDDGKEGGKAEKKRVPPGAFLIGQKGEAEEELEIDEGAEEHVYLAELRLPQEARHPQKEDDRKGGIPEAELFSYGDEKQGDEQGGEERNDLDRVLRDALREDG